MTVNPYNDEEQKVSQVQRMFNRIAPTYDKLNRIISLGLDNSWRQRAIELLAPFQPKELLDIATGTGDLAIDLVRTIPSIKSIIGADISAPMIDLMLGIVRTRSMAKSPVPVAISRSSLG